MIVRTTKIASGDSVRSPPPLRGLSDWDRLVISSLIPTVTSCCSTELRINSSQAEEGRITGLALTHGLRIAACNFDVGLRGSLDELTFVEYLRDGDFPLCAGSTHESRERTQNRKNYPVRYFRGLAIFPLEQREPGSLKPGMRLPPFVKLPGFSGDIEKVLVDIRNLAIFTRNIHHTLKQLQASSLLTVGEDLI